MSNNAFPFPAVEIGCCTDHRYIMIIRRVNWQQRLPQELRVATCRWIVVSICCSESQCQLSRDIQSPTRIARQNRIGDHSEKPGVGILDPLRI